MDEIQSSESPKRSKTTLRWLAFLPAAIAGLFVGGIAANLFFWVQNWFIGIEQDSGWAKINYYVLSSAVSSILAVYWGTRVAPSGRKVVALVLGGLMVALSTLGATGAIMSQQPDLFWSILSSASSAIAAGYVVYKVFTEGDDFSLSD